MAVSSYLTIQSQMAQSLHTFALIGVLAALFAFACTPIHNQRKRTALLVLIAVLKGVMLAPLMEIAIAVDPEILVMAAAGTACIFICFSLSALYTSKRTYLYLGGFLFSAVS